LPVGVARGGERRLVDRDEAGQPHAFERFARGERAHHHAGSGLGLAIVDAIARAHGGRAVAVNTAGAGADVAILLPRR
jgi:signal transduction histidine kinase